MPAEITCAIGRRWKSARCKCRRRCSLFHRHLIACKIAARLRSVFAPGTLPLEDMRGTAVVRSVQSANRAGCRGRWQLQRTPVGAISSATLLDDGRCRRISSRHRRNSPRCFLAGLGIDLDDDAAAFRFHDAAGACFIVRKLPNKFTFMTAAHFSALASAIGSAIKIAALPRRCPHGRIPRRRGQIVFARPPPPSRRFFNANALRRSP